MEILNCIVNFPSDKEKELEHYSKLALLISQVHAPLLEELDISNQYQIVITRINNGQN